VHLSRRALVLGSVGLGVGAGCSRRDAPSIARVAPSPVAPAAPEAPRAVDAGPTRGATRVSTWSLPERGTNGEVAVIAPDDAAPAGARYPLVLALHGRGEALKGPKDGAMGWVHDYDLPHAIDRVSNPPLNEDDVQGFVDPDRLAQYNAQLAGKPYGGLVVVCPYLHDINLRSGSELADYGRYLAEVVVPRARRELPVLAGSESTGIDGVSLGGATAMRAGLAHVDTFGAVGALQPAIGFDQVDDFVDVYRAARAKRPSLALRLTTSNDDVYNGVITRLSRALRAAGVAHDFADVPGPHDYPFNRGPGAIELLLWHDRVLARPPR
jgi:hypothetical protein